MANRRQLKKSINYLCGELFAECVAIKCYQKDVNQDDLDNVMRNVLLMHADLVCRLSHVQPGATKAFFHKLNEDLNRQTQEIIDQIYALS